MQKRTIAIFGSARPEKDTAVYQSALHLGRLLAEANYTVMTGGYMGTMEAVSHGAHLAGGHVVGVTSDRIETFRPIGPNPWIKQEIRFTTLRDRLLHLVQENDGMIALPGGIGTLAELAMAWNGLQTGETSPRPLILLGQAWRETFHLFNDATYINPNDFAQLSFVDTPEEAVAILQSYFA
jgi:uncharacterized protein (TIGR00730 family)